VTITRARQQAEGGPTRRANRADVPTLAPADFDHSGVAPHLLHHRQPQTSARIMVGGQVANLGGSGWTVSGE
jgi:hypothetical protein